MEFMDEIFRLFPGHKIATVNDEMCLKTTRMAMQETSSEGRSRLVTIAVPCYLSGSEHTHSQKLLLVHSSPNI